MLLDEKSHTKEIIFKEVQKTIGFLPSKLHEPLIINHLVPLQLSKQTYSVLILNTYYKPALKVILKFTWKKYWLSSIHSWSIQVEVFPGGCGRVDNGDNGARELRVCKRLAEGAGYGILAGWESRERGQILALALTSTLLLWVNCHISLGFSFFPTYKWGCWLTRLTSLPVLKFCGSILQKCRHSLTMSERRCQLL